MIDVSIVIVNYNVKEYILRCIQSIYTTIGTAITFEIIVVDNNSTDGSIEAIEKDFKEVRIIKNLENAGFPAANNQGFKIANGDKIMMLNPDTEIVENAIARLALYLDSNPDVALVAPKLLNTDGSLQHSVWRFPSVKYIFAEMFYLKNLIKDKYYADKDLNITQRIDSASGAAMMFRKELVDVVGMLDEKLFWIEDVEFCYRIKKHDFNIAYLPEALVIHHIGQSAKKNYNVSIYNQIFNKIKFYRKHHSRGSLFVVKTLSFIHALYKWITFWIVSPFKTIYFRKAKAYSYTLKKFFCDPER
jgi:N-acetylglucosaminyl-diphospho-decaprenol L-rhamnosyltransferase